ncbi:transposase [Neochlamydia sp. AcF65]|uniref:transposase n=1 Tax=Neochlamydia sp. AcF65 TaxID=2795735 RepID=UPI001BC968C9|nr:transposase [Neochlamydia sp. AcF65]
MGDPIKAKRRTWRKIHLSVCPDSHEVMLSELTLSNKADDLVASQMIPKLPKSVKTTYGDGAYDRQAFYRSSYVRGIDPVVPPRRGGRLSQETDKPWMKKRNDNLEVIQGLGGDNEARQLWKKLIGYHRRSLAETAMYRFKRSFGRDFRSRKLDYQRAELSTKPLAMNKMTALGMTQGQWVLT